MADVSSKEIKKRIRSMQSTKAVTKAMETIAAYKLRRSQEQVLASRPYFETLYNTIRQIVEVNRDVSSGYLTARPLKKAAWIVIAGDRGLAGSYNSNVLKLAWREMGNRDAIVLPIGKKAAEFFSNRKANILSVHYADAEDISAGDCIFIAKQVCKGYLAGEFDEVRIAYTQFASVLSQTPASLQILPLHHRSDGNSLRNDILCEPDSGAVFSTIVPDYVGGMLYGCLCESRAAEQAARRTAMNSATRNADELIEDLSLKYNRARQAAVTQEITEIVAGS